MTGWGDGADPGVGPARADGAVPVASATPVVGQESDAAVELVFHALADATRRAVVARLARGPASVSTLAEPFAMSLPSVVQHLGVLERAGVVVSEKTGRVRTYRLVPDGTSAARTWLDAHRLPAEHRLDRLTAHLTDP